MIMILQSLNFVLNSAFTKILVIKSHDVANDECIRFFNCSVSGAIYKRKLNFLTKFQFSESTLCKPFAKNTADELATVREHLCNM